MTGRAPALSVSNLSVSYNNVAILRGVSFTVEPGTCFGLVGEFGLRQIHRRLRRPACPAARGPHYLR